MFSQPLPSKADIKLIRSLGQKKFRDQYRLFTVEGEKLVGEALVQRRFPVEAVYRTAETGEETMARMSHLTSPSPAIAVLRMEGSQDNAASPALPSGLCLGLDSVRDPGNVGTILRLADWFGIDMVYLSPDCVDLYNPKTVQATMGSIFRQNTRVCDLEELVRRSREAGIEVYATALDGEDIRTAPIDKDKALILMGSERDGLSLTLMSAATVRVRIPSFAHVGQNSSESAESLNVAIATAITCYEFRR